MLSKNKKYLMKYNSGGFECPTWLGPSGHTCSLSGSRLVRAHIRMSYGVCLSPHMLSALPSFKVISLCFNASSSKPTGNHYYLVWWLITFKIIRGRTL